MLTTVKIINYLFSINNCSVKASKSYENLKNLTQEVLWIPTQELRTWFGYRFNQWKKNISLPFYVWHRQGDSKSKHFLYLFWIVVAFLWFSRQGDSEQNSFSFSDDVFQRFEKFIATFDTVYLIQVTRNQKIIVVLYILVHASNVM